MGDREGARRQLTALFVGHFIGQDLGGCPQEWRTEVPKLGSASDALLDVQPARRTPFYRGVSIEFRPHGQRETDLVGLWSCPRIGSIELPTVTSNRTDQVAPEDPGEWFSHSPILVDLRARPPVILVTGPTARGAEVRNLLRFTSAGASRCSESDKRCSRQPASPELSPRECDA